MPYDIERKLDTTPKSPIWDPFTFPLANEKTLFWIYRNKLLIILLLNFVLVMI